MNPRLAVRPLQKFGCFRIVHDDFFNRIIGKRTTQLHGHIGNDTTGRGNVSLFNIGNRFSACIDGLQEINHVAACGRGGVYFYIGFCSVCRVFVFLKQHVFMDFFARARRYKIIFKDTATQGALVAINFKPQGYSGSAGVPQVRCSQRQLSPSYSKRAVCVSAILLLPGLGK